jgi:hypothetical protein
MNIDFLIDMAVAENKTRRPNGLGSRRWSDEEEEFLRNNIGELSYEEIGNLFGRSTQAIKIRQVRRGFPSPSKRPGWLTGNDVARSLGVDIHAVMRWSQSGLMPLDVIQGERGILNIRKVTLYRWATRPDHWIYFKVHKMKDFHLKRLVMRAQELWGDRWLTIGEASRRLGCNSKSLNMRVNRGRIPEARKNGNWFIPASVIANIRIYPGKGGARAQQNQSRIITRADLWILHAKYKLEMTNVAIAARMGEKWNEKKVGSRLKRLNEYLELVEN